MYNLKIVLDKRIIFFSALLVLGLIFGLGMRFLAGKLARSLPAPRPEAAVTIREGFNLREVESRLLEAGIASAQNLPAFTIEPFKNPSGTFSYEFFKDAPSEASFEGFLFPDTYRFWLDSSSEAVIKKFLDNFDKKLVPDWRAEIERQNKKIYDAVIMASLIEKEVRSDEDRALVSGILWKRLAAGMKLDVDFTICYIKSRENKECLPITADDKKINSPYNTYLYKGLPPGPISNPGQAALKAAIFPETNPYWYYLSRPDGKTIFSRTLDEHNAAKRRYLK